MRWFGKAYGAPYERDTPHAATPVGQPCLWCDEAIAEGDDGLLIPHVAEGGPREAPWHYACHLRSIVGGVRHQLGQCTCCNLGGKLPPDPEGMTRRQAAEAAAALHHVRIQAQAWLDRT